VTLSESELGRMGIWDKVLTAGLNTGKDIDTAIEHAEKAVRAFEARFHKTVESVNGTDLPTA